MPSIFKLTIVYWDILKSYIFLGLTSILVKYVTYERRSIRWFVFGNNIYLFTSIISIISSLNGELKSSWSLSLTQDTIQCGTLVVSRVHHRMPISAYVLQNSSDNFNKLKHFRWEVHHLLSICLSWLLRWEWRGNEWQSLHIGCNIHSWSSLMAHTMWFSDHHVSLK